MMKPLVQKLPLTADTSFIAKTFRTPHFEVGWHQHIEYELILFTEGSGMSFIGNQVGEFDTGDIYFLGSNLPHTFQKNGDQVTSAVVVQFRDDCWGAELFRAPESRHMKQLLEASMYGLKIQGNSRQQLQPLIKELEGAHDGRRLLLLLQCLDLMAEAKEYTTVSTQEVTQLNTKDKDCIDRVFQFTIDSFRDPITLPQVAAIACMSVPAFCNYFKRSTKKTYIDFLNEVRIGYACQLLQETNKTVLDICYESGYNTMTNFHKQFLKSKQFTPLQYRKYFAGEMIKKGSNIGIVESNLAT
jgi:AraC-like DNA-binding protein